MIKEGKKSKNIEMKIPYNDFRQEVKEDYYTACLSRNLSLIGRSEVLNGKAKFGIFGDGKEIVQLAMAKTFVNGDWRSGYYRDQTFMLATGMLNETEFFAQLYGITGTELNPSNGGRSFNNHFATRSLDKYGNWKNLMSQKNSSSDISPTGGQMPRLLGLGLASKLFRKNKNLHTYTNFTNKGNEVAFGTIGDASTSEGHFFEVMNAAAVIQVPMAMVVYDDGYGISVEKKVQTVKSSISNALKGFEKTEDTNGILIYKEKGWDYPALCKVFKEGVERCRKEHIPVLFHIDELTQPQGHSTSGSHERYKSKERLEWETKYDCLPKMKEWIIKHDLIAPSELEEIENSAYDKAHEAKKQTWKLYQENIFKEQHELTKIIENKSCDCKNDHIDKASIIANNLKKVKHPIRKDNVSSAKRILRHICLDCPKKEALTQGIKNWLAKSEALSIENYNAHLYNESQFSAVNVSAVIAEFDDDTASVPGREVLLENFDHLMKSNPLVAIFGEDVGKIGGVNQSYAGLQEKYGPLRIFDTGIRETSIIGKGIGLALRGFRPIVEIQYFDYLLFALQSISDDLATTHWRTKGGQIAPLIISTRGHRFEGIWHSGSPLSMVINSVRGMHVCVPRDMTRAAGFYNTLLEGQDPALVIEPLNGYRLREIRPSNPGQYRTPLGIPDILIEGADITIVTYGACVRIAQDAIEQLNEHGIYPELIDVQTLLPFDIEEVILESIKKTNRVLFFDEDVPGGASAFMMQNVLEKQKAFKYLDSEPRTLTAKEHRPAYSTDGDYFSNPNAEDVVETIIEIMNESNPSKYPVV